MEEEFKQISRKIAISQKLYDKKGFVSWYYHQAWVPCGISFKRVRLTRNKRFVFFLYDETYISTRQPTEAEATL